MGAEIKNRPLIEEFVDGLEEVTSLMSPTEQIFSKAILEYYNRKKKGL